MKVPRVPLADHGRPRFWLLDANHQPYEATDQLEWAIAMGDLRQVAATGIGGVAVSTVFLGIDHRSSLLPGPPILFETMIFGGPKDGYQTRYETWDAAIIGHGVAVDLARGSLGQ